MARKQDLTNNSKLFHQRKVINSCTAIDMKVNWLPVLFISLCFCEYILASNYETSSIAKRT